MRRAEWIGTRWLGVGLAAILAVVTLGLAVTGRLGLYINPDSTWFAVSMAVVALVGAIASFALPLGAEADHGHDHGDVDAHAGEDTHHHTAHPLGVELRPQRVAVDHDVVVPERVILRELPTPQRHRRLGYTETVQTRAAGRPG